MSIRDLVTTLLDTVGLVAIAVGAGALAASGFAALLSDRAAAVTVGTYGVGALVGGLVLTAGSVLAATARRRPNRGGQQ